MGPKASFWPLADDFRTSREQASSRPGGPPAHSVQMRVMAA